MEFITIRKYLPTIVVSVLLLFALPDAMNIQDGFAAIVSFPMEGLILSIVWDLPNGPVWGIAHRGGYWIGFNFPNILGWLVAAAIIVIPVAVINYLLVRARPNQDVRKDIVRMQYIAVGFLIVYLISLVVIFRAG